MSQQIILTIPDKKFDFVMELLKNLPFVKAKTISKYKSQVFESVNNAVEEMQLIKEGKLKAKNAEDLFNEL